MDGTICTPDSAEHAELILTDDELSQPARTYVVCARRTPLHDEAAAAAHRKWLTQPARTQIRRPLSPSCPLIIGEQLPPPTFWRHPGTQHALPWIGSIVLHITLIVIGLITFRVERPRVRGGIAIESSISSAQPAINLNLATAMVPADIDQAEQTPRIDRAFPMPHEPKASDHRAESSELVSSSPDLPADDGATQPLLLGVGPNDSLVLARAGSADKAPAKISTGATDARFFGISGTGQAVVFVCDASGSMMGTSDVIVNQLQRSLLAMHASQVFNVIFFSGRSAPVAFDARDLISADANNKLAACGFVKRYTCGGNSRGLGAIRSALARNPDLMYLVTDGDFDDSDAVLKTIRAMNADRFTTIHVILVSGAAKQDPASYKFLKQIADENGGTCQIIDPNAM